MRVKMSKPPAPTASAIGPFPSVLQIVGRPALEVYPAPSHHPTTPMQAQKALGVLLSKLEGRPALEDYPAPSHHPTTPAKVGGAMVLGKLLAPGCPSPLDNSRAIAYCAYSKCGWGLF